MARSIRGKTHTNEPLDEEMIVLRYGPTRCATALVRAGSLVAVLTWGSALSLPSATFASAPPKLPTDLGGPRQLEVRPPVISFTGDGTGFFGGFTGRSSVRQPSRLHFGWAGRIRWSLWSRTQADGRGAVWLDNGIPDDARGTFHPYAVTLRAFRPRHGVFTRLAYRFIFAGHTYARTLHAHYVPASEFVPGHWAWPGG